MEQRYHTHVNGTADFLIITWQTKAVKDILKCNYNHTNNRGLLGGLTKLYTSRLTRTRLVQGLNAVELSSDYGINGLILRVI